ncbi:MAG TPA: VOC family protein [Lacipirellulaceae bacterium]|nr:VOC family protein [Gemmatimonadales bacterium]HMO87229.1 VOC family protein [Lacipirellulaceae bacterium]
MPSADLQGATLGQVAIRVHDVGRATAFYRDQLGLPLLFEFTGLAFFRCGDVRLMLSTAEKPEFDHPASILYYRVPDVEASYAELSARGVGFVDTPHVVHRTPTSELWMAFFRDSEGNHAALMAEKAAI